jgi:SAM-dependent methyltransferase
MHALAALEWVIQEPKKTSPYEIFLDSPAAGMIVDAGQVIAGWYACPSDKERPTIDISGTKQQYYPVSRPDVARLYPTLHSDGFILFYQPTGQKQNSLNASIGTASIHVAFEEADGAIAKYNETIEIAKHNEALIGPLLVCPRCKQKITLDSINGRQWLCVCGEGYDCSKSINMIPQSYSNYEYIKFGGAICSHGYDNIVTTLIDETVANQGVVLDCGAGWRELPRKNVISLEILKYPSTDVVAIGEYLPFSNNSFDLILSLHVLEHVKNPYVCAAEIMRVLKPGGKFIAVTPYIVQVHGFPFHFFNPTPEGLRALFADYADDVRLSVPRVAHPLIALREIVSAYAALFPKETRDRFLGTSFGQFKTLSNDEILAGEFANNFAYEGLSQLAANYMITGKKRAGPQQPIQANERTR